MSATWRFFRFNDNGAIEKLSRRGFQGIWDGSEPCLEFAGRSLRIVQVLVDSESRRVRRILRIDTLKLYLDAETGYLDEKKWQEWIRLEVQAVDPSHRDANNAPNFVARRALARCKSEFTFTLKRHERAALTALILTKLKAK